MSIATEASFLAKELAPFQITRAIKPTGSISASGHLWSCWASGSLPSAGGVPTAAALSSASNGALQWNNAVSAGLTGQRIARWVSASDRSGTVQILDRLVNTGGLDGTVITAQTTNLPTTALPTRDGAAISAVGVWAALEIYSAVGTTGSTATLGYTNSSGASGHTSQAVKIGTAPDNVFRKFIIVPMQAGDVGVQSVESVTLSGTTGTAGNFGVTLFRPVTHVIPIGTDTSYVDAMQALGCTMPHVPDDSCLMYVLGTNSSSSPEYHDEITWITD